MEIRAAVIRDASLKFTVEDVLLDGPRDDEVLVRLAGAGICHTDLSIAGNVTRFPRPFVLGHEGAGVIEKVGAQVTGLAAGDSVVMTFDCCGKCSNCRDGLPGYCDDFDERNFGGSRADGSLPLSQGGKGIHGSFFGQSSFATYALCNQRNAVKITGNHALHTLGPFGCGVQTGAGAVMNALKLQAGQSIAIFGTGAVGMSAIMAAKLSGASNVLAIDVLPARLSLAMELGATHSIDAKREEVDQAISRICPQGVDFALDTSGTGEAIHQAVGALAKRGICGLIASQGPQQGVTFKVFHMMTGGRVVRGIIEGDSDPQKFIPMLIDFHAQGRFPFDRMLKFYPFEAIDDAIRDAVSGLAIKPVLIF